MSKRKKRARAAKSIARKLAVERKPLMVSRSDVDYMLDILDQIKAGPCPLYAQLLQLAVKFADNAERLHELEARANANGFWEDPDAFLRPIEKYLKNSKMRKLKRIKQEIAHLSPEEMKQLLAEEADSGK